MSLNKFGLDGEPTRALAFKSLFQKIFKKTDVKEEDLDELFNHKLQIEYYWKRNNYIVNSIAIV